MNIEESHGIHIEDSYAQAYIGYTTISEIFKLVISDQHYKTQNAHVP